MTEANIKELLPTSKNKIIEVKVYRSWISRNPPDVTEKGYHAILLDKQVLLKKLLIKSNLILYMKLSTKKHFYFNRVMQYKQTSSLQKRNSLPPILYLEELIESQGSHVFLQATGNKHWKTRHHFYLHALQNLKLYHQQGFQTIISDSASTKIYIPKSTKKKAF